MTDGCDISSEIALRWTSLVLSDDKSTLVQVMAWCRQATSHCLNQCRPRSLPSYHVTRPQWVNSLAPGRSGCNLKFSNLTRIDMIISGTFPVILPSGECHKTSLMISQHWFRLWLGAGWQQTITWTSVDQVLCCHMVLLGHSELAHILHGCISIWRCHLTRVGVSLIKITVLSIY